MWECKKLTAYVRMECLRNKTEYTQVPKNMGADKNSWGDSSKYWRDQQNESYEKGVLQKKNLQPSLGQCIKGTGRVGRRERWEEKQTL